MNVTVIIVNRKTLKLTKKCLESLFEFYPGIRVIVVDNRSGSDHPSLHYVKSAAKKLPNVRCHRITSGVPHHARGLNAGISLTQTRYFITMDSDVEVLRGRWIEEMLAAFKADPKLFATGHVCHNSGPDCTRPPRKGEKKVNFVHPFCAMWDKNKYKAIGVKFAQTGQPACYVCAGAAKKGYHVKDMEGIHPHNKTANLCVRHVWGGTRTVLAVLRDKKRRKEKKK